ncbi:MAG: hypothetical protein NDI84_03980 [Steroidobacteraceae bacterium]|nr:hypothetical protein [Steroidobacteraceae bacterium]
MTSTSRRALACAALVALLFAPGLRAQSDAVRSPPGEIVGSVTLDGCRAADVIVSLRAEPLAAPSGLAGAMDPALHRTVTVTAVPTGERTLEFRLDGLADGQLYRVGIRARRTALAVGVVEEAPPTAYPPNPCDTIVWEGLPASVAVAGGAAVNVQGLAISGQLQVQTDERRYGARDWSRAGTFRLDDAAGARLGLRWVPPAGVTRGVLQVSLERFDRELSRADCGSPVGLLHTAEVSVLPREIGGDPVFELPAVQLDELIVPPEPMRDGGLAGVAAFADAGGATVTEAEFTRILLGKPLYVRVVPIDESDPDGGPACDRERKGLPGWVVLVIANALGVPPPEPPEADELQVDPAATYRGPVVYTYPNYNHLCMRSTRGHTLNYVLPTDFLVINNTGYGNGDWFPANQRFCWKTGGGGGGFDPIGALTEVVGGLLSPLEWMVNAVSGGWASLKKFAVNAVASGITELGVPCGASCKSVLSAGLEIGLAAAGIPPTIPNFEQLKQQGLDYVAAQVASQTGLPSTVTEWAVNNGYKALATKFTDEISEARGSSSGLPNVDWAAWDNGIEAATLEFKVYRMAVGKLRTGLLLPGNAVYDHQHVGVPRVMLYPNGQPGASSMTFNVALSPNLSGWQEPGSKTVSVWGQTIIVDPTAQEVAGSMKSYWKARIQQNPCVPMAIHREVLVFFPIPLGALATYPSVPVNLNSTPHHAPFPLVSGLSNCIVGAAVP